uniref:Uncharacterized protein n=1 Tax=Equus asinus TaxID=9793 RepID=A0A9L0JLK3_EQUAS
MVLNLTQISPAAKEPALLQVTNPVPPHVPPVTSPHPGADLTAVDPVRGKTALEWALLTDSFDTVCRIRQLLRRPQVEQLSQYYQPEWPALPGLVAQAQAQAQAAPSLLERLQTTLSLPFAQSPQEGGVLDHLVTITTSLASPFLTTACQTLCPDHPPALGTRSKSVPELLGSAPPPPPVPPAPSGGPRLPGLRPLPEPSGHVEHVPSVATAQGQYQPQAPSSQDPPLQGTLISLAVQAEAPAVRASNAGPSSLEIPGAQDGEEEAGGGGGGQVVTEPGEDG